MFYKIYQFSQTFDDFFVHGNLLLHESNSIKKAWFSEQQNMGNSSWKSAETTDSHHLHKSLSESLFACLWVQVLQKCLHLRELWRAMPCSGIVWYRSVPYYRKAILYDLMIFSGLSLRLLRQPLTVGSYVTKFYMAGIQEYQESMQTEGYSCVWPDMTAQKAVHQSSYSKCSQTC